MRQIGKIGRREVFSEVKNVNVKSLKNRSKLLEFFGGWERVTKRREGERKRQREEETEGVTSRVTSYCHFLFYVSYVRYVRYVCNVRYVRYVRHKRYVRFAPFAF